MSTSVIARVTFPSLLGVLGLVAGCTSAGDADSAPTMASAQQVRAVEHAAPVARLVEGSSVTAQVRYHDGYPRSVRGRWSVRAASPEQRARQFLATYADAYLPTDPDFELFVIRHTSPDGDGVVFGQTWKGMLVEGAELLVRMDGGAVLGTQGQLMAEPPDLDATPAITAAQAAQLLAHTAGTAAQVRGIPRLVIADEGLNQALGDGARLLWRISLQGQDFTRVDAHTGEIFQAGASEHTDAFDDAIDAWDLQLETVNNMTNANETNCFYWTAEDDYIGDEYEVYDDYDHIADYTLLWGELQFAHTYFWVNHGRHSYDDSDAQYEAFARALLKDENGNVMPNASWSSACDVLQFSQDLHSDQVVVHEIGHAVIQYTSNLEYQDEPGALNESFADVMAALSTDDWVIMNPASGNVLRNLVSPPASLPTHYANLDTADDDNGRVHFNSAIPSHAFFRMVEGGLHNNIVVVGMNDNTKVERLAYATYTSLGVKSQLIDAADRALDLAYDWAQDGTNGFTDADACTVQNAWAGAGLALPDQDCDGFVEASDLDPDNDGVWDPMDNCSTVANPDQKDSSFYKDGLGDACDPDHDNDGENNDKDNCDFTPNPSQADADYDGKGDACEDFDGDGVDNDVDNCNDEANPSQKDTDGDGTGDACEYDWDGDLVTDDEDNCQFEPNPDQANADGDDLGDLCDPCDEDAQEVTAWSQGFPEFGMDPQPMFADADDDGLPDTCDPDPWGMNIAANLNGIPMSPNDMLWPSGRGGRVEVEVPAGGVIPLVLDTCTGDCEEERSYDGQILVSAAGLSADFALYVEDDLGQVVARAKGSDADRALRFTPRGDRLYRLVLAANPEAEGIVATRFTLTVSEDTYDRSSGGETAPTEPRR